MSIVLRLRNIGLGYSVDQFLKSRLLMRSRLSGIIIKASKCLLNWEGKKLGVSGTVASIKLKGRYNWSVFDCTRRLRAKVIVQLEMRISDV